MSRHFEAYSEWSEEPPSNSTISMADRRATMYKLLSSFEESTIRVLNVVVKLSDFSEKYYVSDGQPFVYVFTRQPNQCTFVAEAFPVLQSLSPGKIKQLEELTFHHMFEEVIQRYTNERRKPNPVLLETRPSDFCYQLAVKFEAIPADKARLTESHQLLREFQVLQYIWESYRTELVARKCPPDQLVGFPMPFEFKNVVGSPVYDFPRMAMEEFTYYGLNGRSQKIFQQPVSSVGFGTSNKNVLSSLSYMSVEKVGPNLPYLMDLMQSQGRRFSLSSALKIYDQLISRLMIMHKYGMTHCDINPTCLNFGCREAMNVLYINGFDKAVLCTSQSSPLPMFHDRFVSFAQAKEKKCHFLYDLESAFYVFLYMLMDRLPWDSQLPHSQESSVVGNDQDAVTKKTQTVNLKEKFWNSYEAFHRITQSVSYEYQETLYCNFSIDVLGTLYARMKDSMAACLVMPAATFFKAIFISGSVPYNCYFGVRKVIASYFRFESLSKSISDVLCTSKLEMLAKEDPEDKRVAWDLSNWCWNYLDTDPEKKRR